MRKGKRIIHLLPFLLWLVLPGSGLLCQLHTIRIPFENLTTKDGLVSNQVNCIVKDSMGFFWYGTSLGLCRHDGNKLESFRHSTENIFTIPNDYISEILTVNRDIVAGITGQGQLFLYDYRDTAYNRIFSIADDTGGGTLFKTKVITTDGNSIYAINDDGSVYKINVNDRTASLYYVSTPSLMDRPGVACFFSGRIWIGAENGLFYLDTLTCVMSKIDLSFYSSRSGIDVSIQVIEPMDDHHLLLGAGRSSLNPLKGVIKLNVTDLTDAPLCLSILEQPMENYVVDIIKKISGNTFFFKIPALTRLVYNLDTGEADTLSIRPNHTKYLNTSSLNCVYSEGNGRYRIGSNQGLYIYVPESQLFKEFYPQAGTFRAKQWTGLYEETLKLLFVGTPQGIKSFKPDAGEISSYSLFPCVQPHHKANQQPSILPYDSTRLLVISSYLYVFDIQTQKYECMEMDTFTSEATGLKSNLFPYTVKDSVCYFIRDGGLYSFHYKRMDLQKIHVVNSLNSEVLLDASGLCFDNAGALWITTYNFGLVRCDMKDLIAKTYIPPKPECTLNDILIDSSNTAWLASTGCGLIKANIGHPDTIYYKYYDVDDGYITSDLYQVMEDDFGRIWSTSRYGINYFEKASGNVFNFSKPHGIEFPHNFFRGKTKDNEGNYYVSGGINIVKISPADFLKDAIPPSVYIKQFQINHKPITAFWRDTSITLRDKENNFAFEIAAINHIHPKLAKYKYRMEGFHVDWISTTSDQLFIPFNNLPAGKYTFNVIAANHQGTWNTKGIAIQLRILPPLVETFWFRALMFAFVLAVLNYIYQQRTQRLLAIQRIDIERKLALEAERSRISRDMHDDLGSGLSAIHLMSNYLKENTASKYPEFSEDIEKIRKSSEDLNQRIREIIWTVNSKDDTLQSLMSFIQRHAHEMSDSTKVPIHVRMPDLLPDISLNGSQRKNLFLAVKEAIHNAIKHGQPSSIDVELLLLSAQAISFRVKDDGKGFVYEKVNAETGGNGLRNMKDRIGEIGGSMDITSSEGGTSITFRLDI